MIDKVLLVGLGSIGSRHLRLIKQLLPSANICVLRHLKNNVYNESNLLVVTEIEEAIQFKPDIAIICNPSSQHVSIAQKLADAKVHLLIEKPISNETKGVSELLATCKKNKVVLQIGYNLRFYASLIEFKKRIDNRSIGKLLSFRCEVGSYLPSWRPNCDYKDSVSAKKELGGGVLLELSHEIDYINWIFGPIEWIIASLGKQSNLEIDVDDFALLILGLHSDKEKLEIKGTINMNFFRRDSIRECVAIGSEGTLKWDGIVGQVWRFDAIKNKWITEFRESIKADDSYREELKHFLESINEKRYSITSGEESLEVLRIVEAARESELLGKKISLKKFQGELV